MIEKEILDRVPLNPGRITLEPVDGMENTFDMKRADNPSVEGTPINKATLDSIIYSRLTGRYYDLEVASVESSVMTSIKTNPIPTSGWVLVEDWKATNGQYIIYASDSKGTSNTPEKATDGNSTTYWSADVSYGTTSEKQWAIHSETPIRVNKVKINMALLSIMTGRFKIRGNTNYGYSMRDLTDWISFSNTDGLKEYTIKTPGFYKGYALTFEDFDGGNVALYEFQISDYDVTTYKNHFVLNEGVPSTWTVGQRIMVKVPDSATTAGAVENTLNGIKINTILQASKRYELIYNGSTFDGKEV